MNKTISINIGGIVFHIEELAYEKLKQYLDSIRRHFSASEGRDEIIADIEARIGEMFQERIKGKREAVIMQDVEEVVGIMGRPEDFGGEAKEAPGSPGAEARQEINTGSGRRRFYRNPDDKVLGGVCSGIASYFDFDPLWLRLAFVLSFFIWGTGILFYIILWIIIPEAKSSAEKLEMKGEKVNISNIEKSVKEEFENLKKKYENMDTGKAKNFFEKFVDFMVSLFGMLFRTVIKIIGVFFIIIGILVLIALLLGMLGAFGVASVTLPVIALVFASKTLLVVAMVGAFLFVGIPIIALLFHGIRILFNVKKTHKGVKWGMSTLWLVGLLILIGVAIKLATEFTDRTSLRENVAIRQPSIDTLYLGVIDHYENTEEEGGGLFGLNNARIITDDVQLNIVKSPSENFELEKIQYASGSGKKEAKENARNVNYALQQKDSLLLFSETISFNNTKWRNQEVKLLLKVPVGKVVYLRHDIADVIYDIKNVTDTYDADMVGHFWIMTEQGLTCMDCTGNEKTVGANSVGIGDSKYFDVKKFTKVNVGGSFKVNIEQGKEFEVVAKGSRKQLSHLQVKVRSKELIIETDRKFWDYIKSYNSPEVFITMPGLERVELSGATVSEIRGFEGKEISFDLSGANKTTFTGNYDEIAVDASGASKLTMEGEAETIKLDLAGACSLDAENMKAKEITLDISGASKADVYVTDKISGDLSGASTLHYKGNPKVTNIDADFSNVKKED